ncbi:Solute carrier family 41 member 1 [Geodia barretti]|uniref:Solute carrier family 41 member 1 n=1 Tax=Geodia barretti TaxID=519541 RepID=A0AA35QVR0_GEOBA|nr:Solute carrier family 41 member 1 [Geodia barretti]
MPAVLSHKEDRDALQLRSKARKRTKRKPQAADRRIMDSSEGEGGGGGSGVFTTSRDLSFRNGQWQKRDVMEMAVIVTEPRATEKQQDRDDGDSGISETTAVEERLLPTRESEARERAPEYGHTPNKETVLETLIQVFIPFMIAGFGMMAAGLLLDKVQHWDVYVNINEIFILVPALLGLKGNLEMTLASRLSTAANIGQLSTWGKVWRGAWGNLSLIQGQALVVAALATGVSVIFGRDLHVAHTLLLGASSMSTAAIASFLLGGVMIGVIVVSHIARINPDNVATPIAASLGDLVTLGLLSLIANWLYDLSGPESEGVAQGGSGNGTGIVQMATPEATVTASSLILVLLLVLIPLWLYLAHRNSTTRSVLFYGWIPVIAAMCISSGGGLVLSQAVSRWRGIAIYSPIINGVGGNLVAVQASRISTSLHSAGIPGSRSSDLSSTYSGPLSSFFSASQHATTAKLLVLLVIPGSAIFLVVIHILNAGHTTLSPMFFFGYLLCAVFQAVIYWQWLTGWFTRSGAADSIQTTSPFRS